MNSAIKRSLLLCASLVAVIVCSCRLPIDTEERDLVELERIWQFSKAYSIYTDRVPEEKDALTYDNPFLLVMSIQDTMHSPWRPANDTFGLYYYDWKVLYREVFGESYRYPSVYFRRLSNSTAYFRIKSFDEFTHREMMYYTDSVTNVPNVILDLRNNGGGFVNVCEYIVELILSVNTPYLYKERREEVTEGKFITVAETITTEMADTMDWGGKRIALLINRYSASASEILAIALRSSMNSTTLNIIGEKSFGKGIGQYVFFFNTTSGGGLKLTSLRFKGVTGNDTIDVYHEKGIVPDTLYTGTFRGELLVAGTWLEPDFENTVDIQALDKVVTENSTERKPHYIGCYKIINK